MTDDRHDDERDPLLVRQFLRDADTPGDDRSTQTWPSATTREVRSQSALEGSDAPTAVLFLPDPPRRRTRRRLLVLVAACVAVLLGAAAAGFATLRTGGRLSGHEALPDAPIPALSGLVPASPAALPTSARAAATAPAATPRPTSHRVPTSAASTAVTGTTRTAAPSPADKTTTSPAGQAPDTTPQARVGTIRGQNGLCLDLNGGVAVDFNRVQVYDCNGTTAQTWTIATDGTLRVLGMCALILGDDTVHVTTCDGRTTARWRADGQLLINAANDECLVDPSAGTLSGTAVKVTTCNGRADQRWSLP